MPEKAKTIVIAFGGNAITGPKDSGDIHEQFHHARVAVRAIGPLIRSGARVVVTHGNGPQVGNALLRMEAALGQVPSRPLGILVADSQGGLGYMIAQVLRNWLRRDGIDQAVVSIVTQAVVDRADPALRAPTKPVGALVSASRAATMRADGCTMVGADEKGYRRLVPSPRPVRIVESRAIDVMLASGFLVVACGGGGVPVVETEHGDLDGVDAVVDKDLSSSVLAVDLGADQLVLLTAVDGIMEDFGTDRARRIPELTVSAARTRLDAREFPEGTMGPKVRGAVEFVESGGREAIITSFDGLEAALAGHAGTRITG